jgi:hypothetical protein
MRGPRVLEAESSIAMSTPNADLVSKYYSSLKEPELWNERMTPGIGQSNHMFLGLLLCA